MFKKLILNKVLAALAVLIIIILSITVVLLLKDRNKNLNNSQQAQQNTSTNKVTEDSAEQVPVGYIQYSSENLGLKFNYPKDWGDVSLTKKARNNPDYEPVNSYFISFSKQPEFLIKISPTNWSFNGGEGEWDYPVTTDDFNKEIDSTSDLSLAKDSNSYLTMSWDGMSGTVQLKGAKKAKLTKISAEFVEFAWNSVDEACATQPDSNGARQPQLTCYSSISVAQTKELAQSFNALP